MAWKFFKEHQKTNESRAKIVQKIVSRILTLRSRPPITFFLK